MTRTVSAQSALWICAMAAAALGSAHAQAPATPAERPPILESETSDVATLAPTGPHRFLLGGSMSPGVRVINGDTARLEGQIQAAPGANFIIDPNNRYFYIAETMWTKLNRGTRQDLLSVYDDQLKLVTEITLPGRLIAVPKTTTLDISSDGKLAYVYNMQPAASVAVVDLVARKTSSVVETPGCGMVYAWGPSSFASLCADGTLAYAMKQGSRYVVRHTPRFFDPENDPVVEESLIDRNTGRALFISYTGLVYPVQLGEETRVESPWSMQEAAGLPRASTEVEHLAWRPGGTRFAAWHKASNRLFVIMHSGLHWTHKDGGGELWVFDIVAKKRIARFSLGKQASLVAVSQDADPLLYVVGGGPGPDAGLSVLNPQTGEVLRSLRGVSGAIPGVPGY